MSQPCEVSLLPCPRGLTLPHPHVSSNCLNLMRGLPLSLPCERSYNSFNRYDISCRSLGGLITAPINSENLMSYICLIQGHFLQLIYCESYNYFLNTIERIVNRLFLRTYVPLPHPRGLQLPLYEDFSSTGRLPSEVVPIASFSWR